MFFSKIVPDAGPFTCRKMMLGMRKKKRWDQAQEPGYHVDRQGSGHRRYRNGKGPPIGAAGNMMPYRSLGNVELLCNNHVQIVAYIIWTGFSKNTTLIML